MDRPAAGAAGRRADAPARHRHGHPGRHADLSARAVPDLRRSVAHLDRTEQGRGQRCTIEAYFRDETLYLFDYLDDCTQTHCGHDERGSLRRVPLRPAVEVVYVYGPAAGTLDLFAYGDRRWRLAPRDRFCEHVLHDGPPPATPGRPAYELAGLLDRAFLPAADPADGVGRTSRVRQREFDMAPAAYRRPARGTTRAGRR
ncbi:MAG: hypothetical protein K2P78_15260 [Gemmataceae bacterium]|nr:hypothetical protein [Gemmataceae bacterium]